MRATFIIARRELNAFFDSLTAYIMLIAFLGFSGFFTWLYGVDVFIRGEADLRVFFSIAYYTLFFFIPALTMKQLAEEKKTGTLEMLVTKAISIRDIIWGKFLACLGLVGVALLFTLPYYLTIARIGDVDHGAIISGYVGLMLMSSAYIGIGLFASSITNNQIVAFLLALIIGIFFHFIFEMLASTTSGAAGNVIQYLSISHHYESITRGVLDTRDVLYFLTIAILGASLAEYKITSRT